MLAGVEDQNPDAHEFYASAHDADNFDLVYDGNKPTPVVYSRCDPTMSLWDVAKVDAVMAIRHGVIGALIGRFADELDRLARSNVLIGIAAAIGPIGRFAPELRYPTWIRLHAAFCEEGQRV